MIIYDQVSLAFIKKAEDMLRQILQEVGINVRRSRFEIGKYLFPIQVVVFEGPELGHFNSPYLQVGLNRKLIASAKDSVLRDILRHELAHYLTFIHHGEVQAHGPEFRGTCARFGFPEEIATATMNVNLENEKKEGDLNSERVLEKVKKLFQLAESSNSHEAELATIKANELLLRHNLNFSKSNDEPLYLERVLMQKRKDQKLVAIYDILRHFIVRPVISMGRNACCLEVTGTLTNVKLAAYVANFLDKEMDRMWEETKKEHGLSGLRAKNSFFTGVAQGFDEKMKGVKQSFSPEDQKALLVVEQELNININKIYRRLSTSSSGAQTDQAASGLGKEKGRRLNIRQGVESKSTSLSLSWR
jgi:hypothetical protein